MVSYQIEVVKQAGVALVSEAEKTDGAFIVLFLLVFMAIVGFGAFLGLKSLFRFLNKYYDNYIEDKRQSDKEKDQKFQELKNEIKAGFDILHQLLRTESSRIDNLNERLLRVEFRLGADGNHKHND